MNWRRLATTKYKIFSNIHEHINLLKFFLFFLISFPSPIFSRLSLSLIGGFFKVSIPKFSTLPQNQTTLPADLHKPNWVRVLISIVIKTQLLLLLFSKNSKTKSYTNRHDLFSSSFGIFLRKKNCNLFSFWISKSIRVYVCVLLSLFSWTRVWSQILSLNLAKWRHFYLGAVPLFP